MKVCILICYLIACSVTLFSCCKDALFTSNEKEYIPRKNEIEKMIFKSDYFNDTLKLIQNLNYISDCNPVEVSRYNTEFFSYVWESKRSKEVFRGYFQMEKIDNSAITPHIGLGTLHDFLSDSNKIGKGVYRITKVKSKPQSHDVDLEYFVWSNSDGFIEYMTSDGIIWKRVNN